MSKRGWLWVCLALGTSAVLVVIGQVLFTAEAWSDASFRGKAHLVASGFNLPSSLMLLGASLILLVVVAHPLDSAMWRMVVICGFIVGLLFFVAWVFQAVDIAWRGGATATTRAGLILVSLSPAIVGLVIAGVHLPLIRDLRKAASAPGGRDPDPSALPN